MEKINRTPAPQWLAEKWQVWGEAWKSKYEETGKSGDFEWRKNKKQGKEDLLEKLSLMTKRHCSFCDAFPMGRRVPNTIEHFKPKSKFPLLAYHWDNLFLCCGLCQEKGDKFDSLLLKPDEQYYDFDRFFKIEWDTGKFVPNTSSTLENQQRARLTIELYKLNENGKPDDRKAESEFFNKIKNADIDAFSYRFFLRRDNIT
jgi:uncharacterized protein (TIGR02646 family)